MHWPGEKHSGGLWNKQEKKLRSSKNERKAQTDTKYIPTQPLELMFYR